MQKVSLIILIFHNYERILYFCWMQKGFNGMRNERGGAGGYREVSAGSLVHSGFDLARMVASMEDNIVMGMWGEVVEFEVEVRVGVMVVEGLDGKWREEVGIDVVGVLFYGVGERFRWLRDREDRLGIRRDWVRGMSRVMGGGE